MSECLVTKLKTSVSDDRLLKLGEVRIGKMASVSPTASVARVGLITLKPQVVKIVNDGYFYTDSNLTTNGGKEKSVGAGEYAFFVTMGSILSISDKYAITTIESTACENVNISDFKYSTSMTKVVLETRKNSSNVTGSIDDLKDLTNLTVLKIDESKNVTGNLSSLSNMSNLIEFGFSQNKITGNISAVGHLKKLIAMSVVGTLITGSIESFVNAAIAAGRTSGSVRLWYAKECKNITFEGIALNSNSNIPTDYRARFTWNASGNITWDIAE